MLIDTNQPHQFQKKLGSSQATKPSEEYQNKNKKQAYLPLLNGTGHDINACKVIEAQANSMKATLSFAHGSGGSGKFNRTNNISDDGKYLNI